MSKDILSAVETPAMPTGSKSKVATASRKAKNENEKPNAKDLLNDKGDAENQKEMDLGDTSQDDAVEKETQIKPSSIRFTPEELDEINAMIVAIKEETGFRRCNRNNLIRAAFQLMKEKKPEQIVKAMKKLD